MKLALFLLVAVAAVLYAGTRLRALPEGAARERASRTAASVRERGPSVVQDVAYGIEKLGEATEAGARTLRRGRKVQDEVAEGGSTTNEEAG